MFTDFALIFVQLDRNFICFCEGLGDSIRWIRWIRPIAPDVPKHQFGHLCPEPAQPGAGSSGPCPTLDNTKKMRGWLDDGRREQSRGHGAQLAFFARSAQALDAALADASEAFAGQASGRDCHACQTQDGSPWPAWSSCLSLTQG